MLDIKLDLDSSQPLYLQIADSIQRLINLGKINKGARLLTPHELADDLIIGPSTVARAYKELVREGVIRIVQGKVYLVSDPNVEEELEGDQDWEIVVREMVDGLIELGVPKDNLRGLLEKAVSEI